MENYIVRIYHRDEYDSGKVTGMLESVERETQQAFHHISALQSLLNPGNTSGLNKPEPSKNPDKAKGTSSSAAK